jgi:hypothetical protein
VEHPKDVGDRSMLAVMLAFRESGYAMYVPFGENTRVDLIVDDGDRLLRVQCKTGRLRQGAVRFKVCSTYAHHANRRQPTRDYIGEIDCFAVFCPDTGGVYLVPIEHLSVNTGAALRVSAPRNNQSVRIRFAADYEIGRVDATRQPRASSGARESSA